MAIYENHLLEAGATAEILDALDKGLFTQTMSKLSIEWKRKQYCKSNFPYIEPVEYKYAEHETQKRSFQYVPILKVMLENEGIQCEFLNRKNMPNVCWVTFGMGKF